MLINSGIKGLYVHVPFCLGKCDYCAFYSVIPDRFLVESYLERLNSELQEKENWLSTPVNTVFVGGGNPSCLGHRGVEELIGIIRKNVDLNTCVEWTFETNPETVDRQMIQLWKEIPSIRISMGVQRLLNHELAILGRRSNETVIYNALEQLSGEISNVGIDLILGIPGCGFVSDNLQPLIRNYSIKHVSAYFLTLEPGTPLYRKFEEQRLPDLGETGPDELFRLRDTLFSEGFEHYEISNYSRSGFRCLHNLNYWQPADYVGVGPSAVSTIEKKRYTNACDLEKWLAGSSAEIEVLTQRDLQNEFVMLRLRLLKDGLNLRELSSRFGVQSSEFNRNLKDLLDSGRIYMSAQDTVSMTDKGLVMADDLMASLFI